VVAGRRHLMPAGTWRSRVRFDVSAWMNSSSHERVSNGGRAVALLAIAALTLMMAGLVALDPSALCLAPALALAVPLLLRRYPGARILKALSATPRSRWARPRSSIPRGARRFAVAAHGGLLIARALAVRPPPACSTAS